MLRRVRGLVWLTILKSKRCKKCFVQSVVMKLTKNKNFAPNAEIGLLSETASINIAIALLIVELISEINVDDGYLLNPLISLI